MDPQTHLYRRSPEKEIRCNREDIGDLLQPAGADAINALLVFLHLLKADADRYA